MPMIPSDGSCCMRDHANAVPPWTCACECHARKDEYMTESMRVAFPTEESALAFIQGVEYLDDDHVATEGPEPEINADNQPEYVVYVRRFA
jgi:hypothetical protein